MTTAVPDSSQDRRLAELEAEHADQLARAHAALAAAQDRYYWLDRWGIDLNALMRRPGASEVRLALKGLRVVHRGGVLARRLATELPARVRRARDH